MQRPTEQIAGIKAFDRLALRDLMAELKQPKFRARQLEQWLYGKGASSYDDMTNLPAGLRAQLADRYPLFNPTVSTRQVSRDASRKYLVTFADGTSVETVGIPSNKRLTVCVSTQAGCAMKCAFCATGKGGLVRSLAPGEICDQVRIVADDFGERPSNVVTMGQGEPFANYDNTLAALRFLNSPDGFDIGARHLTVSTCGILPMIRRFSSEPEQFTLAISLHSARQQTRNRLMPGVRSYDLERLRASVAAYGEKTGRRPSFEYALIAGENDTDEELDALVAFCKNMLCHVNLIPLNTVSGTRLRSSTKERAEEFARTLGRAGIEVSIRNSRGSDIAGACGQLQQQTRRQP
jgi:23S rRNA (adenine2503-C2)-methyltransferase